MVWFGLRRSHHDRSSENVKYCLTGPPSFDAAAAAPVPVIRWPLGSVPRSMSTMRVQECAPPPPPLPTPEMTSRVAFKPMF